MYDIFENPWLLFSASMIILFAVVLYRRIFPEKYRFRQFIIPFILATAAFGTDYFVKTDYEKIELTIKQAVKAVVDADINRLGEMISPDYSDSMYISKKQLLDSLKNLTSGVEIEKIKIRRNFIKTASMAESSELHIAVFFQPNSEYTPGRNLMFIKLKLHFRKTTAKKWLIYTAQIISLNNDLLI